jgi:cytochrome P450
MTAPASAFDLMAPDFKRDPYPTYARLRDEGPGLAVRLPDGRPAWLFTRYEDVARILKDHDVFSTRSFLGQVDDGPELDPEVQGVYMLFNEIMLGKDPPEHTRLRRLVQKAFTSRMITGLAPRIRELSNSLLDAVEKRALETGVREFDLITDFEFPLPVTIIMDLLGIPPAGRDDIHRWSTALASFDGSLEMARQIAPEVDAFIEYLKSLIKAKRETPSNDLLTALAVAEDGGDRLTEHDLLAMVYVLIFAGHETTLHLIGNGMRALLTRPDQFARLNANLSLVPSAVEEMLRFDPSVEIPRARLALADAEVGGVTVRRGDVVLVAIASANRDAGKFPDPDAFEISRGANRHLSFGTGIHVCIGSALARLEGQIAIETLLRRMPDLRLAVADEELVLRPGGIFLRGLAALPVQF